MFKQISGILALVLALTVLLAVNSHSEKEVLDSQEPSENTAARKLKTAVFAGGCFWCMQPPFDKTPGVKRTVVGYTGGHKENPSYHDVSAGSTGHVEAIQVFYDPKEISYEKLLDIFWHNIDPFDNQGQFCDKGPQYRSAIFISTESEQQAAEASKQAVEKEKGQSVFTDIKTISMFYDAEEYHQDYYKKNPLRYKFYRYSCGRDSRLGSIWK
ncbi:MAG: peptide-methionine (S)-S-oxide reductase MsrA [Bdellovibrionales bacterium]|nr:peptide-methionine (S)-S-oxide reductase MsrA [Bdellovibrionales bacterium]